MTPDRVADAMIGQLEEAVKKHREQTTDSMLAVEQYAHAVGYIQGLRTAISLLKKIRSQYLADGRLERAA